MRRVSDYSPRCRSAIACKSGIVGAVAANEFPYEWGFPRFVKVLAFVAVAGFALFAGDDDVTWGEFAWNIAFGTVGVVAIVVLLIRPRVRLDENGMVLVRNPIRSHRFDAWDILDYDWSFLGYMTIELWDGRTIGAWAIQPGREARTANSFAKAVERCRVPEE